MKASEELEEEKSMKEILERLESLEELNESAMDGRARRNNYHARLVALGAKVSVLGSYYVPPFNARPGLGSKEHQDAVKDVEGHASQAQATRNQGQGTS